MTNDNAAREAKLGGISAISAYVLWGVFPLYFKLVGDINVYTIIAHRVVWSALFVALFLLAVNRIKEILPVFSSKKSMGWLVLSTLTITINWTIFVWAIDNNQVLAVSFGYFINPLVNVLLGMVLLGERQNKLQALAIGIALVAVAIQAFGLGGLPWISLALAFSFAFYGYFRKTVAVGAAPGLLIETMLLVPFAIGFLFWFGPLNPLPSNGGTLPLWALLMLCGPVTAVPLILFAIGARRLRLTTIGIFQYIAPSIQFVLAVWLLGEELSQTRLISFILIWVSLVVFTYDSISKNAQAKREKLA
ncbi:EamA family transporter RarD [uncultured Maritalea sp.]|jgi:chloramphenicol-sensitive protein RarD|uniref:EamA family transporter RarD n=1 Tax=uncultured Maritalea sp. TaxID=757249 RepID=UPI0026301B9C|nr:EamA family transporter RarD [uncultured Maritalea sp.]